MFKITPSQKIQSLQSKSKKFVISVSHQKQRKVLLPQSESENGRWSAEEHNRFIDAIIKYGNDWKKSAAPCGYKDQHPGKVSCPEISNET